ncbi:MAG TPA: hypothetical protein VGO50_02520 [Pyrinomonadaceae bacterium]|jgi:hypothetical protein|nr:hypothetical protein [Pyrinomonadaceae bacterium]
MKRVTLLLAAIIQSVGAVYILTTTISDMNLMTLHFGVGPHSLATSVIVLVFSASLLLVNAIIVWSKNRIVNLLSLILLTVSLLCNFWLYVRALETRTGVEAEEIRAGVFPIFTYEWIRLSYWEPWFFLSTGLMFVVLVLTAFEFRKRKIELRAF